MSLTTHPPTPHVHFCAAALSRPITPARFVHAWPSQHMHGFSASHAPVSTQRPSFAKPAQHALVYPIRSHSQPSCAALLPDLCSVIASCWKPAQPRHGRRRRSTSRQPSACCVLCAACCVRITAAQTGAQHGCVACSHRVGCWRAFGGALWGSIFADRVCPCSHDRSTGGLRQRVISSRCAETPRHPLCSCLSIRATCSLALRRLRRSR